MSTVERNRKFELAAVAPQPAWAIFQNVAGIVKMTLRLVSNRIHAGRLADLDDHQLADIGLARSDISRALDVGLLEDPTMHLSKAAMVRARTRFSRIPR